MSPQLKTAKYLGGIGGILSLLGGIPSVGWLLSLSGLVMEVLAVKKIADLVKRKEIFREYLVAIILGGLSGIILVGTLIAIIISSSKPTILEKFLLPFIVLLFIGWFLICLGGYFTFQSFKKITQETKENLFHLSGKLAFIGSILLILVVGIMVVLIAQILTIVAFFSLPDELSQEKVEETKI